MAVNLVCPNCKSFLQVPETQLGNAAVCGRCRQAIVLTPRAQNQGAPPVLGVSEQAPLGPSILPPTILSNPIRSGPPRARRVHAAPSNLVPILSWVGVTVVVIGLVVAVFVIGNRRRAEERRRQDEIAKAAPSRNVKQAPLPANSPNSVQNGRNPFQGFPGNSPAPTFQPPASAPPPVAAAPLTPKSPLVPPPRTLPPPTTVSAPPKPLASDPFAQMPAHIKLPSLIATASEKLLVIGERAPTGLQLIMPHADIPKEAAYLLEERSKLSEWAVLYCPNIDSKPPVQTEIAKLSHKEGGLWCQWTQPLAEAVIREQLSNGHLAIKAGDREKRVALRAPRQERKLVIDLLKQTDVITYELGALPRDSAIAIQLLELENFTRGARWKNTVSVLPLGKKATIEFENLAGPLIELAFTKRRDDTLVITVKKIFMEQTKPVEMSLTRLDKMEESLPTTISRAKRDRDDAMSQLSSLQSDLRSLQSREPSNLAEVNAMNVALKSLEGKIGQKESRIRELVRRIPRLEEQQNNLPEARKFLQELHQKAAIKFNIVAAGAMENDPMVLVRGTENP